ncbi:MAG: phosphodiester glycosidase family protein [Clostridia bacterium]|nr:phosphodiester glycosidase family protein [Clostridia bacterium]
MKPTTIRLTLSALTAVMLLTQPLSALSYTGLGEITSLRRDTVGGGLTYTQYLSQDENGRQQTSYVFEYKPGSGTLPLVRYGSTVYGKDRLATLVSAAGDSGLNVLGAINGDFYSTQTGVPLGVMIDDGRLISTDDGKYALGFTKDGQTVIGQPSVKITITNTTRGSDAIEIDQLNKFPTIWGVYLLTEDFASTTLSASESKEIIIRLDDAITTSGNVTGRIVDIVDNDYNAAIPEGCAVLSVAESYEDYPLFAGMRQGDRVRIDTTCAVGWENVTTAVGGGDLILSNGVMPEGIIDEEHEKVSNPRTAAGIREDGSVVFFAVDGRSSESRGLTETELASVMAEMGCVTALNLDGGGSTSVMVKASTAEDCISVNAPADGSYRSLANGLLFVSEKTSDGVAAALSVQPNTPYVLAGSTVNFSAYPLDRAYMPAGLLIGSDSLTAGFDPDYTYDEGVGSFDGGSFTAGDIPGEYRIEVAYDNNGKTITGDVTVLVIDAIDSLNVSQSYMKVKPGSLVDLNVYAFYNGREVVIDRGSLEYTINGTHIEADQKDYPGMWLVSDIGCLDFDGNFQTFGNREGEAVIEIKCGELSQTIRISSGLTPDPVVDFEEEADIGKISLSTGSGVSDAYIASSTDGYKSSGSLEAGFRYSAGDFQQILDVKLREGHPISPDAQSIKLWVSGDISGQLTAVVADENGTPYTLSYNVTKDYSRQLGWRELTADIPASLKTGTLTLTTLLSVRDTGDASRTIRIDDAVIYYGEDEPSGLTGIGEHWAKASVERLWDMGVIQAFDCKTTDDGLYYDPDQALTRGEFAKIIALWMGYNAYNYTESGVTLEDGTPYDKVCYIRAVLDHGLMNGRSTDEDGTVHFDANASITRQEAMKVIGSLLTTAEGKITFADVDEIADWALSGVAKCVSAGVVNGYGDNTIRPGATISRGELAAILGRMG